MKLIIPVFILFLTSPVFSQIDRKADSLIQELKHSKKKGEILIQLSELYLRFDQVKSYDYAEQAFHIAGKENDQGLMGDALRLKARVSLLHNEYEQSSVLVDSAEYYFRQAGNAEGIVKCSEMKALILMLQGNYDEALRLFENSAEQARALGDKSVYSSIRLNMGRIYRARGDHQRALENFQFCLRTAKEINNEHLIAYAYFFIGTIYQDQHNNDEAIENYMQALPLYEKNYCYTQIPYLLVGLGSAYRDNKNYAEALNYFRDALVYYTENNDRWGINDLYSQMGLIYMDMHKNDSAWYCFDQSLQLSRAINEKAAESNALHYLGNILMNRKDYDRAMDYLQNALQLNNEVINNYARCRILISKGSCLVQMGKSKDGLKVLNESLAIADSMDLMTEQMILHKQISSTYSELKRYDKALHHYELYADLNDSLFRAESNLHFLEMERKYQSEKQKQEISQLKLNVYEQETTLRKQRSQRNIFILGFLFASVLGFLFYRSYHIRKKSDQEKEALLKEIHHRVKNNLQIISSLLSIQTDSLKDAKVISAVQESQSRVKAMGLIHQLLYQDQDLSRISFETYLPQLINAIGSIFKKEEDTVTTNIQANQLSFEIDTAIPLGLIITELSSNAFKYAFNRKPQAKLEIILNRISGDQYALVVSDNGPGLPGGIKIEELESTGLRLVKILTDQLDGNFSYNYNKGAIFTVQFSTT